MADLTDKEAAQTVKITGSNPATGIEDNYMEVDSFGNARANLRDTTGTEIGTNTNPIINIPQKSLTYFATNLFTMASTPTDIFTITGSATKTIKIHKIGVNATKTSAGYVDLLILKRSTANTGGTPTLLTNVPADSNNAVAEATVRSYTANPTLGTLVGPLKYTKFLVSSEGAQATNENQFEYIFSSDGVQPLTLRGVNEVISINLLSGTMTGNSFSVYVQWTEE